MSIINTLRLLAVREWHFIIFLVAVAYPENIVSGKCPTVSGYFRKGKYLLFAVHKRFQFKKIYFYSLHQLISGVF
jgi:hypothetical protein